MQHAPQPGRPFLIGTAGHVDHGKTTLVKALTGIETDRLEEERRRGLSIDLGFAEFRLPSGRLAGIVDVPGHERFLKNMLAGAAGVDFGLLVIAADEGVMPQTREHLAIMHALRIPRGLAVLTKADTVEEDWLDLVRAEARAELQGGFLENAPMLAVDSVSGRGLDELVAALDETAAALPAPDLGRPAFLPVDRVFTRTGFGVVITGSLRSGALREGDPVTLYPAGKAARVRGLQMFGEQEAEAQAGMRTAVNLAGLEADDVERGDVLATPGSLTPSDRVNVLLELHEHTRVLKHRARVRVHLGTAEILARVLLWEGAEARPGTTAMAQLHLERPAVARRGDRFVVRWYSPQDVLGGGMMLEPNAAPFRARDEAVVRRLRALEQGDPADIVREALNAAGERPVPMAAIAERVGLPEDAVSAAVGELVSAGEARNTAAGPIGARHYEALGRRWTALLTAFHRRAPLRPGMPREELRSQDASRLAPAAFDAVLAALADDGTVVAARDTVRLPGFEVRLRPEQEATVGEILEMLRAGGWQPPGDHEILRALGPHRATTEIWDYLAATGRVIPLGENLHLHGDVAREGIHAVRRLFERDGSITVASFRDALGASRRVTVPFLEWCDTRRFTRRDGDVRLPGSALAEGEWLPGDMGKP